MLRSVSSFLATSVIASTGFIGYCYYLTAKNYKQHQQQLAADTLRDASRLTNDSYGISWGFQADQTVAKQVDSGDLVFIRYDCQQCLTVNQYLRCLRSTLFKLDDEYHAVGFAVRDSLSLKVLFSPWENIKIQGFQKNHIESIKGNKETNTESHNGIELVSTSKLNNNTPDGNISQNAPASPSPPTNPTQPDESICQGFNGNSAAVLMQYSELVGQPHIRSLIVQKLPQSRGPVSHQKLMLINSSLDKLDLWGYQFVNYVLAELGLDKIDDYRSLRTNDPHINVRTETNKTLRSV